ncbi:HalOD1 output domain-containing protein [Halostagnicola sp. A-GB9-2]|uniref:HalOD1 output domain-containing protein n=1 Tax=Halostagnicola sp. A-GB9-2 TaxID=3048066 RepID=UPI0024BF9797|nr:HalOD1 output domain-containing protein [Halostagnicola sp. A-GB9-2]MDJ1432451.1 hypothetical protein [Halostagnicola sp. A-GB9-2]
MDLIRSTQTTTSNCIWDLIDAVAESKGVEPSQLPPIYETIDPEPIESLINGSGSAFELTFEYVGYQIRITRDGYEIIDDGTIEASENW